MPLMCGVRIEDPHDDYLTIVDDGDHPKWESLPPYMRLTRGPFGYPEVSRTDSGWRIEVRLQKPQPQSGYYTGPFYVASRRNLSVQGTAHIFADNLPAPTAAVLKIAVGIEEKPISFADAQALLKQLTK
jgi:hypothetical protein